MRIRASSPAASSRTAVTPLRPARMAGPGSKAIVATSRSSVVGNGVSAESHQPTTRTCCASTRTAAQKLRAEPIDGPGANAMVR
eukprot:CAMPEP_0184090966 /NCGR_PEP_ID=MMETSP0974-20121125/7496_1 /TAXON_ID=483370 /ORGANISM="non described non described, Strain CCMP2097" /LENGTH=83 /DNA_ID=CAMNT_0026393693 /DNA_START=154 /DNA_END=401 /DNA_ORIENTATION=+